MYNSRKDGWHSIKQQKYKVTSNSHPRNSHGTVSLAAPAWWFEMNADEMTDILPKNLLVGPIGFRLVPKD